ncbi:NAD-dependent epimerase/dehydratase family protein [Evansella tamaricis]|uniref:NAD-dependent epimerase/dehydratase family protein n=1 Tax=Evansella tamaricis TaxID=2069301 RepID=A0ABS6J949_9BACI|nr:NAD-dependent epimerase/dehydratase family protein [Evansella tamaricis]MBU9710218.1 NAD-dependent epimerase/dehydratase family protein [Evansella tamaricis]
MKKALVAGATGGMGYALVQELTARGVEVVAFSRGKTKLEELYNGKSLVTIFPGDALNQHELLAAAEGTDVIFHSVSFPYPEWQEKHLACIENMIVAAETHQAKVVLVDNIYGYGKQSGQPITENAPKEPHTKKGKIRLEMENRLKGSGFPVLVVHLPDLYGPNAHSTILYETLKNVVENKKANFVGNPNVAREFLYTIDAAKAIVELATREDTYNRNWNIPSPGPITGEELIAIIREVTGYQKPIRIVSKRMIQFIGLFSPFMRELVEMMYLTETPVLLSGEKYKTEIGPLPRTPYKQGLQETIKWMHK